MPTRRAADAVTTAVVVPVRSFDGALSRLAGVLDRPRRRDLMRELAGRVVAAARPHPVHVVTSDPEVAEWAGTVGATAMRVGEPGPAPVTTAAEGSEPGLTASVTAAVERLAGIGVQRAVVAHADLPLVESLEASVGPGLTIAPDRHRDGSNVVCVPAAGGFRFAYGPGSFQRHLAEAGRLGLPVTVVDDPALAWDLDHPEDLAALGLGQPQRSAADRVADGLGAGHGRLRRSRRAEGESAGAGRGVPGGLRGSRA